MISNASPLIFFSKINRLDLLCQVFPELLIVAEVFKEIVERGKGSPDAVLVGSYVKQGRILVKELSLKHQQLSSQLVEMYLPLDRGEAETISLVLQEHETEILMDDAIGRKVAELNQILPGGSLRVLLLAYERELISGAEVQELVSQLLKAGLYVGAEVVGRFQGLFRELERKGK